MNNEALLLVGCVHSGHKAADIELFKDYISNAKSNKQRILLLGDLFECAVPSRGEGMVHEQDKTVDEQLDEIAEILEPVSGQIIGAVTSNHSERVYKDTGINLEKRLLRELHVPDSVYKGQQGVVMFAGRRVVFAHGMGSGSNDWGDAKRILSIYPEADIVALSHKHELQQKWHGNLKLTADGRKIPKFVPFVRTGSLMSYPRYAQKELYTPQKPGFAVIHSVDGKLIIDTNGVD